MPSNPKNPRQQVVDTFNEAHPVGSTVMLHGEARKIAAPAYLMGGLHPMVRLEDRRAPVLLKDITPAT